MERLAPYLLLLIGMGAAYLAVGGLVRLRPERPEFWLFGMGVRSRAGAGKVLVVAVLSWLLGYSALRRGSIQRVLDPLNLHVTSSLNPEAATDPSQPTA